MSELAAMAQDLRRNVDLYRELLALVEAEHRALNQPDTPSLSSTYPAKKNLLPRLAASLDELRKHRAVWQRVDTAGRARHPEIGALLRLSQDAVMKIIVLDRENEQGLLRRGLLPAHHLPPAARQRPHFVAGLYRRQSLG
jgi:hypothetical protein